MTSRGNDQWQSEAIELLHRYSLADDPLLLGIPTENTPLLYDVVIICHEDDRRDAIKFRDHLTNDIFDDKKIKAVLYGDINDETGKLSKFELALKYSSFVFIFITEKYVIDESKREEREQFIVRTLQDPQKRWSVIPVYNRPRASIKYKIPIGLNSIKGLNYWANDAFYRETVRRLLNDKIVIREQKERRWRAPNNTVVSKNDGTVKHGQSIAMTDRKPPMKSCQCSFSSGNTSDHTPWFYHSNHQCEQNIGFRKSTDGDNFHYENRQSQSSVSLETHSNAAKHQIELGRHDIFQQRKSGHHIPNECSKNHTKHPKKHLNDLLPLRVTRENVSKHTDPTNLMRTNVPNAPLSAISEFSFPSNAYSIKGPPPHSPGTGSHILGAVDESSGPLRRVHASVTPLPPRFGRETYVNPNQFCRQHICGAHNCRTETSGCTFIADYTDHAALGFTYTDLEIDDSTNIDDFLSEMMAELVSEDNIDVLSIKGERNTFERHEHSTLVKHCLHNHFKKCHENSPPNYQAYNCESFVGINEEIVDDTWFCSLENCNLSNDSGDFCTLVC